MKEIINIHIGQAGVQIGDACWQRLATEHRIDSQGRVDSQQTPHAFFREDHRGTMSPRALFLDLEPTPVDELKKGKRTRLYNHNHMVTGKEDSANNYIRGHYTISKAIADEALDSIRKMAE